MLLRTSCRGGWASIIEECNEEIVAFFDLPSVDEKETVFLSVDDLKNIWHFPTFYYSQDKCYHNKIYIVSEGNENRFSHMNRLIP